VVLDGVVVIGVVVSLVTVGASVCVTLIDELDDFGTTFTFVFVPADAALPLPGAALLT
jgi:hypothetical protein